MGNASSMLTQYDIEEVQDHCNRLFSQQEIVSLYARFCQLDRSAKGFISADEFLSVPEFAMNPLSHRLIKMVDGLNFKDFVAFLSAFSTKANISQKVELIFKVYDFHGTGKVTFESIIEVLRDLTGPFMSEKQSEEVLTQVLREVGYARDSILKLDDFIKILGKPGLKMEVSQSCKEKPQRFTFLSGLNHVGKTSTTKSHTKYKVKGIAYRNEIEWLSERLSRLEEEAEAMKQVVKENLKERNRLINNIYQQLKALHNHLRDGKPVKEQNGRTKPGLPQVLHQQSNPSLVIKNLQASDSVPTLEQLFLEIPYNELLNYSGVTMQRLELESICSGNCWKNEL